MDCNRGRQVFHGKTDTQIDIRRITNGQKMGKIYKVNNNPVIYEKFYTQGSGYFCCVQNEDKSIKNKFKQMK